MHPRKLLRRLAAGGHANVRFLDFQRLVEACGFELDRVTGSHHIFVHPDIPTLLNLQDVGGHAKPYQVRQFPRLVERYDLRPPGQRMSDYHINLFYSDEDGGYIADIPDLDACSAFGSTPQEALTEVLRAKEGWIATARDRGIPVPKPRYRPALYA